MPRKDERVNASGPRSGRLLARRGGRVGLVLLAVAAAAEGAAQPVADRVAPSARALTAREAAVPSVTIKARTALEPTLRAEEAAAPPAARLRGSRVAPGSSEAEHTLAIEEPVSATLLRDNERVAIDLTRAPLTLRQGELFVVKTPEVAAPEPSPSGLDGLAAAGASGAAAASRRVHLPYQARFLGADGQMKTCEVVAELVGGGLRILAAPHRFVGEVYIKLQDRLNSAAAYDLPQAMELLITAAVDHVVPNVLSISSTNRWHKVSLDALSPSTSVGVKIRTPDDSQGLTLNLTVTRPVLSLTIGPPAIQGFGLEAGKVLVLAAGLPDPGGHPIALVADHGQLSAAVVLLDERGTATADLRSSGMGPVSVQASSAIFSLARADARFKWPLSFLVAALLGASMGTVIMTLRRDPSSRRRRALEISGGVMAGVVAAVASALGVNLLELELPSTGGEAVVFLAAALGGLGPLSLKRSKAESP